jgi:S1-C subfamily serine protease
MNELRSPSRMPIAVTAFALALTLGAFVAPANGQRARDPALATVFVRVVGSVRVEEESTFSDRVAEREVELGTGSGFVFTPYGHVLTNHHVVANSEFELFRGASLVSVHLDVDRVEVVLPAGSSPDVPETRYEASVEAVDPDLDLAVLSVTASELPYLAFGDSEAAAQGDAVRVYGFPFGARVEVGQAQIPDIVPRVSATGGSLAAARADELGEVAYLQTSASVNPGNSGGPMVDDEGYLLGVVRLRLRNQDDIGFAIPVNRVKDYFDTTGYSQLLPVERFLLGGEEELPGKGLRLRLPDRLSDRSPARLRAESDPADARVRFAVDRVYSPLDLGSLERVLLEGETLETFRSSGKTKSTSLAGGRGVRGSASGVDTASGEEAKMEYALFSAGDEKVLARFWGPADDVAFNRSVLMESLSSLEIEPLLVRPLDATLAPDQVQWTYRDLRSPSAPSLTMPSGWDEEVAAPFPCAGLPQMSSALASSPQGDFTASFRVAWWDDGLDPVAAAGACADPSTGGREYAYRVEWLGVTYDVRGEFVRKGEGTLQLEVVSPAEKTAHLRAAGTSWMAANGTEN